MAGYYWTEYRGDVTHLYRNGTGPGNGPAVACVVRVGEPGTWGAYKATIFTPTGPVYRKAMALWEACQEAEYVVQGIV